MNGEIKQSHSIVHLTPGTISQSRHMKKKVTEKRRDVLTPYFQNWRFFYEKSKPNHHLCSTFQDTVTITTVIMLRTPCSVEGLLFSVYYTYSRAHSVCPLVWIGSAHPLSTSECDYPPEPKGGGNTRLQIGGGGGPNSNESLALYLLCVLHR